MSNYKDPFANVWDEFTAEFLAGIARLWPYIFCAWAAGALLIGIELAGAKWVGEPPLGFQTFIYNHPERTAQLIHEAVGYDDRLQCYYVDAELVQ